MKLTDAIIKRITDLSVEYKLTLSKWGTKAGITSSTLYGVVNHKRGCPRLQTVKLLCDYIKITLPEFFNVDYILAAENDDEA